MISIGSLFIGLAMVIAAVPFVIQPLAGKKATYKLKPISKRAKDNQEQSQTIGALRDLDFDHQIGKVAEEDYQVLRERLMLEAAGTLTAIGMEDKALEEAITLRKAKKKVEQSPGKFCHACGSQLEPQNLYCTHCGTKTR